MKFIKKQFTLIEVLIVVIILGTLAAIVIPKFGSLSDEAKEKTIKTNLQTVRTAIQAFKTITGVYPNKSTDLAKDKKVNGKDIKAQIDEMPTNPVNNKNNVNETNAAKGTATDKKGWNYNKTTGEFWADTTGYENL